MIENFSFDGKDNSTALFLHKLSEIAKEKQLPTSLVSHFNIQSWQFLETTEKYQACKKCYLPPSIPLVSSISASSKICQNCGHENKHKIQIISPKTNKSEKNAVEKAESIQNATPSKLIKQTYASTVPKQTSKNVKPNQKSGLESTKNICLLGSTNPSSPLLQLSSSKKKNKKKIKVEENKDPDFLKILFEIKPTSS